MKAASLQTQLCRRQKACLAMLPIPSKKWDGEEGEWKFSPPSPRLRRKRKGGRGIPEPPGKKSRKFQFPLPEAAKGTNPKKHPKPTACRGPFPISPSAKPGNATSQNNNNNNCCLILSNWKTGGCWCMTKYYKEGTRRVFLYFGTIFSYTSRILSYPHGFFSYSFGFCG